MSQTLQQSRRGSFLWDDFIRTDLIIQRTDFEVPIYFFVGAHDLTTNPDLSRDYFERVNAPTRGFCLFRDSAHSPLFEEPIRAIEVL